jgi:hypothetical protein
MKKCVIMMILTACVIQVNARPLPWPAATSEALYLPFGLQWFMEMDAVKKAIVDYGPARCAESTCRWMANVAEGTAVFELSFHAGTLVGCELDYTLMRDAGEPYLVKLDQLKQSTAEWLVRDLRDFPPQATVPHDAYSAETKDARIIVKWRQGEHSLFINIKMNAK